MRSNELSRAQRVVALARAYPARTALILLAVALGLYFLIAHFVPTDVGEVRAAIAQVRSGLADGDADRVMDRVSPDFYQEGIDKTMLSNWLHRHLARRRVDHLSIVLRDIRFQDDAATASLAVRSGSGRYYLPTEWEVGLEKIDGRWLVRRAKPTRVAYYASGSLRDLLRMW